MTKLETLKADLVDHAQGLQQHVLALEKTVAKRAKLTPADRAEFDDLVHRLFLLLHVDRDRILGDLAQAQRDDAAGERPQAGQSAMAFFGLDRAPEA